MNLLPFDDRPDLGDLCPKCLSEQERGWDVRYVAIRSPYGPVSESLEWACRSCHYIIETDPADAGARRVTAQTAP